MLKRLYEEMDEKVYTILLEIISNGEDLVVELMRC